MKHAVKGCITGTVCWAWEGRRTIIVEWCEAMWCEDDVNFTLLLETVGQG